MSADRLWAMNHEGIWSVKQTADLLHKSLSAAYCYYHNRELTFSHLRQFMHYAPLEVAMRLARGLFDGSPILPIHIPASLDFNGDGDVDSDDVLDSAIDAIEKVSQYLQVVRDSGAPNMGQASELVRDAIVGLVTSERCLQHIADTNTRIKALQPNATRQSASTSGTGAHHG